MKTAIIDPSLFTIPYDAALATALAAEGAEVLFFGRRERHDETVPPALHMRPHFYRVIERVRSALPRPAFRLVKGAEHGADMMRLRQVLAAERPDVIHFQWAPLPIIDKRVMPLLRRIAPCVLTVHDTTPFNGSPNSSFQQMGAIAVFDAFDHLIVHTEQGRQALLRRGIAAGKLSVIPHGVLAFGAAAPKRDGAARVILLFGKIKQYKGTDLLIEAFARLPDAVRRATRVRVVGEPFFDLAPLKARAAELGIADRIDWDTRYVSDAEIGTILAAADILAFPYREIDASGVLMASFPYGKPIVATSIGAFRELLKDGEHGRLVPPEDPSALAAALEEVLGDPARARAMGARVRALAAGIPGWDEIARRTLTLYRKLSGARRAGVPAGETARRELPPGAEAVRPD
jgi:glycosyltransferase involved in cell wall biosynthesis